MCGSYNIKHKNGDNYILYHFWGSGCDAVGRPIDPKPESTVRIVSSATFRSSSHANCKQFF